jgi:hypothetical protein
MIHQICNNSTSYDEYKSTKSTVHLVVTLNSSNSCLRNVCVKHNFFLQSVKMSLVQKFYTYIIFATVIA